MKKLFLPLLIAAACAGIAHAQGPPPGRGFDGPPGGVPGKWWTSPQVIRTLGLTAEQQRGIEDIFQQTRPQLIDLSAALEKEEAILEPLLEAEHPQEARVLPQIDRVAEARAALEKANARMLFRFRSLLSADQWRELQSLGAEPGPGGRPGRRGPPPRPRN